jgi:sugar phosphate isomerase/epimerase
MKNLLHDIRIGTLVPGDAKAPAYIRQIKAHGFESFSITFWRKIPGLNLKELAAQVREAIGDDDIKIHCLGAFGNPLEKTPEDEETVRAWEALIDHAHLFGADVVAGFAGRLRGRKVDESIDRFREVFTPLAKRAADRGVRLAFENCDMGGDWNSGDWNIAFAPTAWEMMFNAVPYENVGLEWEPCHQMVSLIDPLPQLRKWIAKVFHVHGKDATVMWDVVRTSGIRGGQPFVYHRTPGFGDTNWTDVLSILRMAGYKGSIDIEGWHDPVYKDALEMTGQVHALRYLQQCRGGDFIPNPIVA